MPHDVALTKPPSRRSPYGRGGAYRYSRKTRRSPAISSAVPLPDVDVPTPPSSPPGGKGALDHTPRTPWTAALTLSKLASQKTEPLPLSQRPTKRRRSSWLNLYDSQHWYKPIHPFESKATDTKGEPGQADEDIHRSPGRRYLPLHTQDVHVSESSGPLTPSPDFFSEDDSHPSNGPDNDFKTLPRPDSNEAQGSWSILRSMNNSLPLRLYNYSMLGLPHLYFARIAVFFEYSQQLNLAEMEALIQAGRGAARDPSYLISKADSKEYERFKVSWAGLIDTFLKEWKILNLVSVLLLSAIISLLQIEAGLRDPFVHYPALCSLSCALMAALYACGYTLRFNLMRVPHKALQWAKDTQDEGINKLWNTWVILALPGLWFIWSLLFFIFSVAAFVCRGDLESYSRPSSGVLLALKIGLCTILIGGVCTGGLVTLSFIQDSSSYQRVYGGGEKSAPNDSARDSDSSTLVGSISSGFPVHDL
ncbi:hypothetical protein DFP72DRAFT_591265 [Ephemerocybe angulata]|uniref:Uncharacterized protein n=1 Tax=Ephemerocybe angulata TaxID=980116 RepID=A0A8H6MFA6_9AGAR|nr:hypothetical protein DFP72DRAFT_591265 [Tulosesus angulatus]